MIDAKDLIDFCAEHCKSNSSDCTLELKYIANVIEFQKRVRNTKGFL